MIPGVNIISGKVSILIVKGAGGSGGHSEPPPTSGVLGGGAPLRKFLSSKEQESLG